MTSIKSLLIILLLSFGCSSATEDNNGTSNNGVSNNNGISNNGASNNGESNNGTNNGGAPNNTPYDALLTQFVDVNGQVDYTSLKADNGALLTYVSEIGSANISAMGTDEKLAFYINAYNAIVLLEVIDQYPTASVMDIVGFFDVKKHKIAGKMNTLNELENDIIRPDFSEPRIHFALVCAAKSCPPLQQKAYRAETLDATLERVTTEFIETQTTVDGKNITTSKIFDWFGEDFVASSESVGKFLAIYLPAEKANLEAPDAAFTFTEYSWALNEQ